MLHGCTYAFCFLCLSWIWGHVLIGRFCQAAGKEEHPDLSFLNHTAKKPGLLVVWLCDAGTPARSSPVGAPGMGRTWPLNTA